MTSAYARDLGGGGGGGGDSSALCQGSSVAAAARSLSETSCAIHCAEGETGRVCGLAPVVSPGNPARERPRPLTIPTTMASPLASPSPAATALAGRAVLSSPCTHRHVPRAPVGVSYRVRVGVRVSYRVPGPSPTPTPNQGWAQAVPNAQSLACGPKMVTLSWPRRWCLVLLGHVFGCV